METIGADELFDWFKETVYQCTSGNLQKSDEELGYIIFEELDANIVSFLHEISLNKLQQTNHITDEQKNLAKDLREKVVGALKLDRDISFVRNDKRWAEIFSLGDKLNTLIKEK